MIKRGTWFVLVALVALLGLAWLVQWSPEAKQRKITPIPTPTEGILSDFNPLTTDWIDINHQNGKALRIHQNADHTWGFVDVVNGTADQGKIQQLLSSLSSLTPVSTLDASIALDAVGLSTPNETITIKDITGKQIVLIIGTKTATGSGYYVQVDSKTPVVSSKYGIEDLVNLFSVENLVLATPTPAP